MRNYSARRVLTGSRLTGGEKFGCFTSVALVLFIIGTIVVGIMANFAINDYTDVYVTDKVIDRNKEGSKYLIFTTLSNGKVRVFENDDSLFFGKFNSSDVQASLKIGSTYSFRTKGWRIPFFSMYENIISYKEILK